MDYFLVILLVLFSALAISGGFYCIGYREGYDEANKRVKPHDDM